MATTALQQYVFLSYAPKDAAFTERLAADLQGHEFDLWIDRTPATRATHLRSAIQQSFALLLIASPNSRECAPVRDELTFAAKCHCPVCLVLVDGEAWAESACLGAVDTPYIDLRGEQYAQGVEQILDWLQVQRGSSRPAHLNLDDGETASEGYVQIITPDGRHVAMDGSAYGTRSFRLLLDTLYSHYLYEQFQPFRYSTDWVLAQPIDAPMRLYRLAISISWISTPDKSVPLPLIDPGWSLYEPSFYGISSNSVWEVLENPQAMHVFGYYTLSDSRLTSSSFRHLESLLRLSHNTPVYFVPPAVQVEPRKVHVLAAPRSVRTEHVNGHILFDPNEFYRGRYQSPAP
jgi:hypothetical protein